MTKETVLKLIEEKRLFVEAIPAPDEFETFLHEHGQSMTWFDGDNPLHRFLKSKLGEDWRTYLVCPWMTKFDTLFNKACRSSVIMKQSQVWAIYLKKCQYQASCDAIRLERVIDGYTELAQAVSDPTLYECCKIAFMAKFPGCATDPALKITFYNGVLDKAPALRKAIHAYFKEVLREHRISGQIPSGKATDEQVAKAYAALGIAS